MSRAREHGLPAATLLLILGVLGALGTSGACGTERAEVPTVVVPDVEGHAVVLERRGPNEIEVIKAIRAVTGLGLRDSKDLFDAAPSVILSGLSEEEARRAAEILARAGAETSVVER